MHGSSPAGCIIDSTDDDHPESYPEPGPHVYSVVLHVVFDRDTTPRRYSILPVYHDIAQSRPSPAQIPILPFGYAKGPVVSRTALGRLLNRFLQ